MTDRLHCPWCGRQAAHGTKWPQCDCATVVLSAFTAFRDLCLTLAEEVKKPSAAPPDDGYREGWEPGDPP